MCLINLDKNHSWQSWNIQLVGYYPYMICNVFATGVLAVFQCIVIAGCKSVVGYIFTSDEWVSEQRTLIPLLHKGNFVFCLYSFTVCRKIVKIVSENLTVNVFLQFFDALLVCYYCCLLYSLFASFIQPISIFFLFSISQSVCVFSVCLLRDSYRIWDAENCCLVQPGVLLLHWSTSGNSSDVCYPAQNFR